jgi:1-deoxy-D-xylulose-5-phosphate reductoisomerase
LKRLNDVDLNSFGTAMALAHGSTDRPGAAQTPTDVCSHVKSITILGATGSVGTSALDLIGRNPDVYDVVALTAQSNVDGLAVLARRHRARYAVIGDAALLGALRDRLAGTGVTALAGPSGLLEAAAIPADCTLAAIVGAAGLEPTFRAVAQGNRVALANKECLVSAGEVFMQAVAGSKCELLPVDSEHSAAFQALNGARQESIERIVLTASGGPFRGWSDADLDRVTPEQALRHPNWSMGAKITIDSATLMNKGLELIEAFHLFPVSADQLGVIVHPQSIVHCLVHYRDGSVLAQLACPDMRIPIALSLAWPARMETPSERLDLVKIGALTFEEPDRARFPALGLATAALERGGGAPAILNAANEVAVGAFLDHRIAFRAIAATVAETLERAERDGLVQSPKSLEDVLVIDREARRLAQNVLGNR